MMQNMLDWLYANTGGSANGTPFPLLLTSLLLAFVLGQAAAWVYAWTHDGLSYSRAFVQSILLLTLIVTLAMMVIGGNIVIAFGLVGALSVIRFRNILKDTRDTAFIFFVLIVGMACGTMNYLLAVIGAVTVYTVVIYLSWTNFGSRLNGDAYLRFRLGPGQVPSPQMERLLHRHCREAHLVSQRVGEDASDEVAFRLSMRNSARGALLVEEIRALPGVADVTYAGHEAQTEV